MAEMSVARNQFEMGKRFAYGRCLRPGDADNAHTAPAGGGRDRGDGVLVDQGFMAPDSILLVMTYC